MRTINASAALSIVTTCVYLECDNAKTKMILIKDNFGHDETSNYNG